MLTVVAALIQSEGKLLVCQRRRGSKFELLWEFPGGKVEPGETLEYALERELREELGVAARIGLEVHSSSTNIVRRGSRLNWSSSQRAPRRGTCGIWNSNESSGASRHRCRSSLFLRRIAT